MPTLRLPVDPENPQSPQSQQSIAQAAALLKHAGTVAFPTETVYGLGANALDSAAIAKIFAAKRRPAWDPLIVHIADEAMLQTLVLEVPESARKLIQAFWPGPLTLLLPRSSQVPDAVTAGRSLVGARMPAHPVALELIRRAAIPIAAPSANRFGHTSPTTAAHVLDDLDGCIDAVLDAGPTSFGLESTVLDPNPSPMILYRPGAVTLDQIRQIAGPVEFFREPEALASAPRPALPSPGVGLRHYAPKAQLILLENVQTPSEIEDRLHKHLREFAAERIGIMLPSEVSIPTKAKIFAWGNWSNHEELAHNLFAGLRHLDSQGCTVILCPVPSNQGIGAAMRDRLRKAASPKPAED